MEVHWGMQEGYYGLWALPSISKYVQFIGVRTEVRLTHMLRAFGLWVLKGLEKYGKAS